MSQRLVGSSGFPWRNAQRNSLGRKASLETMKNRFPATARAQWRQRFVAIARQAEAMGRPSLAAADPSLAPRRPAAATVRAAIRVRFAAITSH